MTDKITPVPVDQIVPGDNDRQTFDPDSLRSLATSIDGEGLQSPIILREIETGDYQIVAGERRYRAIREVLGWDTVPAIVRELDDEQAARIMLIENMARDNLNPLEEAMAYHRRMVQFGYSVEEVAMLHGISPLTVENRLRMLGLRDDIKHMVVSGQLPIGYATTLGGADLDPNRQLMALARFRDNPNPSISWWHRVVYDLQEAQNQESLFDMDAFMTADSLEDIPVQAPPPPPPTPETGCPAFAPSDSLRERLQSAVQFWDEAAEGWDRLGKNFKRDECVAAALALRQLVSEE
jgi:ParB/RepB/Spo0J family partition protein